MKKPNILIICLDQMRKDAIGHLGCEAAYTPNIDNLASEGVSFANAFCQNPVCTPSRVSMLTGLYPHVNGHRTMTNMIKPYEQCLLEEVKNSGYYVWLNSRNDFLPAQNEGFYNKYCNEYFVSQKASVRASAKTEFSRGEVGSKHYYSFLLGESNATAYLDSDGFDTEGLTEFLDRMPKDKPSMMFIGYQNPHPPYVAYKEFLDKIDERKIQNRIICDINSKPKMLREIARLQNLSYDEKEFTYLRKVYLAMGAYVDDLIGKIILKLKEVGEYDNTAIFVVSDHGDYTGDYGLVEKTQNTFEDCLTNVPFIVKLPKDISVDKHINDNLIENIDIYATVKEIAGISLNTTSSNSKSLLATIKNKNVAHRSAVYSEGGRLNDEIHCIERSVFGSVSNPTSDYFPRMYAQSLCDGTHEKATMVRTKAFKYIKRKYESDELYNLVLDPTEIVNEINNSKYVEVIRELERLMLDWYQSTCDTVPHLSDARFPLSFYQEIFSRMGKQDEFNCIILPQIEAGVPYEDAIEILFSRCKK